MLCVFCNQPYTDAEGCCDKAAMSIALTALQYHADCDHQEPKDAMTQLRKRLDAHAAAIAKRKEGPHSRACGLHCQGHGLACHPNCPTCHGRELVVN